MKNEKYEQYKKIKDSWSDRNYDDIGLDRLAGYFIADMVYHFKSKTFLSKLKTLIRYFMFIPTVRSKGLTKEELFGWSIKRADYKKLSDAYLKKLGWKFDDICLGPKVLGRSFRIDFSALFYTIRQVNSNQALTFNQKLISLISIHAAISFYRFLQNNFVIHDQLKKYLSFNSSFEYESVFTSFLRKNNIETYTMQHGMYFEFKNEIPFEMIGMYFSTAEYFLAWGEFTSSQIGKFIEPYTTILIFGNPLYSSADDLESVFSHQSKKILVCLPRINYKKESEKLLSLLSEKEFIRYEFFIRPHPSLVVSDLELKPFNNFKISTKKTLADEFHHSYLAMIGFNTTVLFESIFYKLPILQFRTGNDEFFDAGFTEFKDKESLINLIEKILLKEYVLINIDHNDFIAKTIKD